MLKGPQYIPSDSIKKVLITLHGYGANGEDLFDLGKYVASQQITQSEIAVYSPNAVESFEMGGPGYQWFGLPDLGNLTLENGVHKAMPVLLDYLKDIIDRHQVTYQDICILGFSQGCMMALSTLYYVPIGAVMGLSGTWVRPYTPQIKAPKTQVFLAHGLFDMVVPYSALTISQAMLAQDGISAQTLTIPQLGHGIDDKVLQGCVDFYQQFLRSFKPV